MYNPNNETSQMTNQIPTDNLFEQMLEDRLSTLGEPYRSEFYRLRDSRTDITILSSREIDLLTLEAMENDYKHKINK